jgi:SNF2 family DNA or RNA helicase
MQAPPNASSKEEERPVGRVYFSPDLGEDYLYFVPASFGPHLRVLKGSMWFTTTTRTAEVVYRAATSLEALIWIRENLGLLKLSKDVHAWYFRSSNILPTPDLSSTPLYEYQQEAARFLADRKRAMLALSPGLGKTLTSITAASRLPMRRVLVVAPLSLLYMWKAELEKWAPQVGMRVKIDVWHKLPKDKKPPVPMDGTVHWIITNPETATRNLAVFKDTFPDLLILDESTLYKNRTAQRTKKMMQLAQGIRYVWLLTGTPATRYVDDMWSQISLLKPKAYSSYWRFAKEYCLVDETPWGQKVAANRLGAEKDIKNRFRDIYFARSQDEVLDLPDWIFTDLDVVMTPDQQKRYQELRRTLKMEITGMDAAKTVRATSHLALVTHLIQVASNPLLLDAEDSSGKWDALEELIAYYPGPYLVWTTFIKSSLALAERLSKLGLKTARILGETSAQDRQSIVEQYQSNQLDALVIGQAVGSYGFTLTAARTAFYVERRFDGDYFQSLHRFRRIGTTHSPNVIHLRSVHTDGSPTIDKAIDQVLSYRSMMIKDLTFGMLQEIL